MNKKKARKIIEKRADQFISKTMKKLEDDYDNFAYAFFPHLTKDQYAAAMMDSLLNSRGNKEPFIIKNKF